MTTPRVSSFPSTSDSREWGCKQCRYWRRDAASRSRGVCLTPHLELYLGAQHDVPTVEHFGCVHYLPSNL